jgi:uncharacterized protein YyaL (SSP411 family)
MSNRLSEETSPYLLQHADNPVDWHPWDETALALARESGKPILLSIGYSACHWCHVMAHESFEDEATARLMNDLFVNIKIDREERPDLDRIYQTAHQLLAQRPGGWPLTVFLTADAHLPIFAGTYFPHDARYGMPAFRDVLVRVAEYAREHGDVVRQRGHALIEALDSLNAGTDEFGGALDSTPIAAARTRLERSYDAQHGGFGGAPKFPHPTNLEFLLACSDPQAGPDESGWKIVAHTLSTMATRGLYDHLGGGFFRYSVDGEWRIPHFEKMLYDNAALLRVYSDACAAGLDPAFGHVASETADWITREMQAPDGGYFSTLDADSEGEEGKFYVWTPQAFAEVLDAEEFAIATRHFGLDGPANFEGRFWHLQADRVELSVEERAVVERAKTRLLAERDGRVSPGCDEKRIVAWNGLTIAGMARAARRLGRPELADSAMRAVDFIRGEMFDGRRLKATYKDGRARFEAYLDDYAFLSYGLLELLQARWRNADLDFACALMETILEKFSDPHGGFFFTAEDHEKLIHRPKPLADEAIPSGNGIAALVLQALGALLGDTRFLDAARTTLQAALPALERYPEAHGSLLRALISELQPPTLVVVRASSTDMAAWQKTLDRRFAPNAYSFCIPADVELDRGLLADKTADHPPLAYVCHGTQCDAPVESIGALKQSLAAHSASAGES